MKLKWIGHAGFKIENLLIDPLLKKGDEFGVEPVYSLKDDDKNINIIIITHGHDDHFAGSWELAKETNSTVVGTPETIYPALKMRLDVELMNIGGTIESNGWKISLVQAIHTRNATGVVMQKNGITIYHAGDTALFGDMKLIGDLFKPDVALLPIGGRFTMDEEQASLAAKLINAKIIIPMHYNTVPLIPGDPNKFKRLVEKSTNSKVLVLNVGDEINLENEIYH